MTLIPLWTAQDLIKATGGTLTQTTSSAPITALGVNFDSRIIKPGDVFLALKGERDGHDYVPAAFKAGAALAVTRRPIEGGPCLLVADVQKALEAMAVYARERATGCRRGAVTGSVGKTSVTQMVMAGLRAKGRAHSAIKSFNNHIGVPLTLSRMPADTERAVFEIGMNHADEISPLSEMVEPEAAIITTVGGVHTENFPDGELGVARAKAEIFDGMNKGALAILNADNGWFNTLNERADFSGLNVATFGETGAFDARLISHSLEGDRAIVRASLHGQAISFRLQLTGKHQALNALATLLMLEALDVDLATALEALEGFAALDGRGKVLNLPTPRGEITLIDESYNANPLSMKATIESLGRMSTGKGQRKIVVLTDMLELGQDEALEHARLSDVLEAQGIDKVYCAGTLMKNLWDALPEELKGAWTETARDLIEPLNAGMQGGDIVMIKGSHGSKAHLIAHALIAD
jgi:UDP-N-acetylmuramoyl-tripeptide--D-alanyl-D-alanine ligase